MSSTNLSTTGVTLGGRHHDPDWRWLMARGAVAVVLGVVGLALIPILTLSGVLVMGAVLIGASLYQLARLPRIRPSGAKAMHIGYAIAYAFGGLAMVFNPPSAAVGLTLIAAFALGIWGFRGLMNGGTRHDRRLGIIAIVAGTALLIAWPLSGMWGVGVAIATLMLALGGQNLAKGVVIRRQQRSSKPKSGYGTYIA